jgi:hypothetical protein
MPLNIDSTELIYLVLGPGALMLAALLLRVDLKLRARCDDLERRLREAEYRLGDLAVQGSDHSRENELEARITLLTQQQEQLMLRDVETGPYFLAVRYAESGASVDSLIEQTGITRSEAELIWSLHGKGRREPGADTDAEAPASAPET